MKESASFWSFFNYYRHSTVRLNRPAVIDGRLLIAIFRATRLISFCLSSLCFSRFFTVRAAIFNQSNGTRLSYGMNRLKSAFTWPATLHLLQQRRCSPRLMLVVTAPIWKDCSHKLLIKLSNFKTFKLLITQISLCSQNRKYLSNQILANFEISSWTSTTRHLITSSITWSRQNSDYHTRVSSFTYKSIQPVWK